MSGIDDLMAESNDRWAHAIRRAQGIEDNGLGEAVKGYYTRYFPAGLFLVAVGTAVGILGLRGTLSDWLTFLAFGFLVAVLGVVVGGLVYNAKKVVPAAKSGKGQRVAFPRGQGTKAGPASDCREGTYRFGASFGYPGCGGATAKGSCHPTGPCAVLSAHLHSSGRQLCPAR